MRWEIGFVVVIVTATVIGGWSAQRWQWPLPRRWLVAAALALASVDQPLQQCGTRPWVVSLGWALGWVMYPVCCGLVLLLVRGSSRERLITATALIVTVLYGRTVMWEAVRLCNPS
jgi:hypothetical protein